MGPVAAPRRTVGHFQDSSHVAALSCPAQQSGSCFESHPARRKTIEGFLGREPEEAALVVPGGSGLAGIGQRLFVPGRPHASLKTRGFREELRQKTHRLFWEEGLLLFLVLGNICLQYFSGLRFSLLLSPSLSQQW